MSGRAYSLRFITLVINVYSLESLLYSQYFSKSSLNVYLVAFRYYYFYKLTIYILTLQILIYFSQLYSIVLSKLILSIARLSSLYSSSLNLNYQLSTSTALLSVPSQQQIIKSYIASYSPYLACLQLQILVVVNIVRFQ